ncbi:MAG: MBOAT family O-acyltransferase [Faecousia sp.]
MSFTMPVFFLFFPVVLLLYWLLPGKFRWILLLGASLFFYAYHNVWLLGLILGTVLVTYLCARWMEEAETQKERKGAVVFSAVTCLGILAIFKYLDFLTGSVVSLCNALGGELSFGGFGILLPMGISFYVFQSMSYTFDVYRGTIRAERHLGHYALFVTFFPQLVAGPIERPGDLLPQLKQPRSLCKTDILDGIRLLLRGYGKKVLIADFLAGYVDHAYDGIGSTGGAALAAATVFFAFQIYCDFSGYSDIAQGCGRLMGIRLSDNFRQPYAARSIRDFWQRWHISLTRWFRDYLYIPLGGSRKGLLRTCIHILITFLVSGLWHGADWTFVLWGGLHGMYMVIERLFGEKKQPGRAVTFLLVCFAWIFFRSESIQDAFWVVGRIFTCWDFGGMLTGLGMTVSEFCIAALLIALLPGLEKLPTLRDKPFARIDSLCVTALTYFFLILAITVCRFLVLTQHGETAFIYFQF